MLAELEENRTATEARAKKLVIKLATNWNNPGFLVLHREAVDPDSNLEETHRMICRVGQAVKFAFEADNAYERDWYLLWARVENAKAQLGPPWNRMPMIPMAEGSQIDVCVSFVQRNLQKKMAICAWKDCKAYFFKGHGCRGTYCSTDCSKAKARNSNLRSYHKTGKARRKAKGRLVPLSLGVEGLLGAGGGGGG